MLFNASAAARWRRTWLAVGVNLLVVVAMLVALCLAEPDDRVLAAPMFAIAELALFYMTALWAHDGTPPVFEVGTFCVLATAAYGIFPMAGFLMMHGVWDKYVDGRLLQYPFVPAELGEFGWRYVVYMVSFIAMYLTIRRGAIVKSTAFELPQSSAIAAIVIVLASLTAFKLALRFIYGYDLEVPYSEYYRIQESTARIPYMLLQVGQNLLATTLVVQQALLILLLARWRYWCCRIALVTWLGWEMITVSVRLGSRTGLVMLLVSAGILYHRLVRPLSFRVLIIGGALLTGGFLMLGAVRNTYGAELAEQPNVLTVSNEFQGLFVTAFDLEKRKEAGSLNVPWQVYASDAYLIIPSQFLPFEKIDPATWYIELIGQKGAGVGFMFGVMSQAALGFGWAELVLRGAALALVLALLHRWYVRRAVQLWPTLLYLFVATWTYYTFRASTFWFVYFVVYRFVPVLLATKMIEILLSRIHRRRAITKTAPA